MLLPWLCYRVSPLYLTLIVFVSLPSFRALLAERDLSLRHEIAKLPAEKVSRADSCRAGAKQLEN